MQHLPDKRVKEQQHDAVIALEQEISALEIELNAIEDKLNNFEAVLRARLQSEILRIRELSIRYKKLKQAKKAKRLEQKKKGKNYKEPVGIVRIPENRFKPASLDPDQLQALKRLYKEAIVQVHPDKFARDGAEKAKKATALTIQLNALYQQADLEELSLFHQHIINGNAMAHQINHPQSIPDATAMLEFLEKKRNTLMDKLLQAKQSTTYEVLMTYDNPHTFIDELREQFHQRIRLLEKRTRKA